jgi:hypothetical protein
MFGAAPIKGVMGRSEKIGQNRQITLIDWSVDDDQSAVPVTILLCLPNTQDISVALPGKITATIQYGIGGAQNEMTVDILPGNIITLPATFIRVNINCDATGTPGAEVVVSGFICRMPDVHAPAKSTVYWDTIIPANVGGALFGHKFSIPSMARRVRAIINATPVGLPTVPTGSWQFNLYRQDSVTTILTDDFPATITESPWYIIPGDVLFVGITNTDPLVDIVRSRLVFEMY